MTLTASSQVALADYILYNAKIYTVDQHQPWASAVAIQGERIIYVGNDLEVMTFAGAQTRLIDTQQRLVLPGFVESHWHFSTTAFAFQAFVNHEDPQEVLAALKHYVDEHPDEKAITGMGWIQALMPAELLCKETLDAICPDKPVCLLSTDYHSMWVNSKALEIAEIDRHTPPVEEGASWFEKDPVTGEPTGLIVDGAAYSLLMSRISAAGYLPTGIDLYLRSISVWQEKLVAAGITTVFDAGFLDPSGDQSLLYETLQHMEREKRLKLRVTGSYINLGSTADPVDALLDLRERYSSPLVKAQVLKLMLDGTEVNHTAYLLEPYTDKPETRGSTVIPAHEFAQHVRKADAHGIDVMVHCVGDAAVRLALDVFEETNELNPARDRRHVITHAFLTHADDIPRFRRIGVIANTQLQWGVVDAYTKAILKSYGHERWSSMYKFRTFIEQGVTVSIGMDGLACQCRCQHRPVEHIECGHTRQLSGEPDAPVMPEASQKLSIPQLIAAYTINGAYQLRMEHEIGSITVGKRADMIILENDLFEQNAHDIGKTNVLLTMMNGVISHQSDSF
ncbi:amidohydrolase [Pseudomonas frederiksbergensis]|uniref:Amidohydrolase n=1 Tax=Pseudomonas frederiksbergensis TaxID=104087 RepID=A0A1J0ES15_9PSED|nr:amidohydrolase [Pseudomonas frederiksbergensis]APC18624.1 amidohydrolase [Pseudomonas frederiksbergensis]